MDFFLFLFLFLFCYVLVLEIYFYSNSYSFFFLFFQSGETPLFISSQEGHIEVVKELIKGKANIDAPMKVSGIFLILFWMPKPQYLYNTSFLPFSPFLLLSK